MKRFDRPPVRYFTREEVEALVTAPSSESWSGRRDTVMFATLYNTGARVSELIAIKRTDITIGRGSASVDLHGKGRKDRTVPLWPSTLRRLKHWFHEIPDAPDSPVFPDSRGFTLSRSGVEYRLKRAALKASQSCPSLRGRPVSPHLFRHTTAMHMLHSGVDLSVIALWLGHESIQTTHMYMEADLQIKEAAMARVDSLPRTPKRYKPSDKLLQFLEAL
jgi:site-specific recombinase XerD